MTQIGLRPTAFRAFVSYCAKGKRRCQIFWNAQNFLGGSKKEKRDRSARLRASGIGLLLPLLLVVSGCTREEDSAYNPTVSFAAKSSEDEFSFGVHPLHNPQQLYRVYGPLVEHLNKNLGGPRLRLVASFSYASFEERLYSRRFDFALPNPYQTVRSLEHGYSVFGKMGDDHKFRGILLVRRDSGIQTIADLKGKVISYPAETALAAAMLPQAFLQENGLDVMRETTSIYVGSQESSIMNVVLGTATAGATWPPIWARFTEEQPDLANQLEVKWATPPLVNNSLVARDGVPADLRKRIEDLLFALHESDAGRTVLARMALSRFEPAGNLTYEPVLSFLDRFSKTVRPIK